MTENVNLVPLVSKGERDIMGWKNERQEQNEPENGS